MSEKNSEANFAQGNPDTQSPIPIVLSSDSRYRDFLYISVLSAIKTKLPQTSYDFYLLISPDFKKSYQKKFLILGKKFPNVRINFINMHTKFSDCGCKIKHITTPSYYRLNMASLLPDYDKCIYLDADCIVLKDLSDYFGTDLDGFYAAGVIAASYLKSAYKTKDYYSSFGLNSLDSYINAGAALWNLKAVREDGLEAKLLEIIKHNLSSMDQDAINIVFRDKIKILDLKYNLMTKYDFISAMKNRDENYEFYKSVYGEEKIKEALENPVIIHYADKKKPWDNKNIIFYKEWHDFACYDLKSRIYYNLRPYFVKILSPIKALAEKFSAIKKSQKSGVNGLITYRYNDGLRVRGYYNPDYINLGDYIQSLAAKQFVPHPKVYIDRDFLGDYRGKKVNMIMNAWWEFWEKNEEFSPDINPCFVSFHINSPSKVKPVTLQYLKLHEPIGCRDITTLDFLTQNGIKAYFSGCLTLTFAQTYHSDIKDDKIYLVDYESGKDDFIDAEVVRILKGYEGYEKIYYSHAFDFENNHKVKMKLNPDKYFELADRFLRDYSRAKLVITSRIHCALPCLAMGTPVVLVSRTYKRKFKGLIELLNYVGKDENGDYISRVDFTGGVENNEVKNSDDYKILADEMTQTCRKFFAK